MNRSKIAAAAVAVALVATPVVIAAPAHAASKPCVTKGEYKKIKKGQTRAKVKRITGTNGKRIAHVKLGGYTTSTVEYRTCAKYASVMVSYSNGKVTGKAGVWI